MSFWRSLTRQTVKRKILMRDSQIPDRQKEHRRRSLRLLPVRRVSHILTWRRKELKKLQKQRTVLSRLRPEAPAVRKNVLTDQEIADADCIIVAADAKVPMERFDGKKVIECQVSDGISKADQLIERAINGDAPVYHAAAGSQSSSCQYQIRRKRRT